MSYSGKNQDLAGEIKRYIEKYDHMHCFLAHDDIRSGAQWEKEIISWLDKSDYFIPLQTPELIRSYWCQQEAGYAIAKGISIVPILIAGTKCDPVGFYAKFQGIKFRADNLEESVRKFLVDLTIINDEEIEETEEEQESDRNDDIEKDILFFGKSGSWNEAGRNTQNLLKYGDKLTVGQIRRIAKAASENDQVKSSFIAKPLLTNFFKKNSKFIPVKYLEEFL